MSDSSAIVIGENIPKSSAEKLKMSSGKGYLSVLNPKFTKVTEELLEGYVEIKESFYQPNGIVHGGVTAGIVETFGSGLSFVLQEFEGVVGMELSVHHIRSVSTGTLFVRATMIHRGRRSHVVQVEIWDEEKKRITLGKITNLLIE